MRLFQQSDCQRLRAGKVFGMENLAGAAPQLNTFQHRHWLRLDASENNLRSGDMRLLEELFERVHATGVEERHEPHPQDDHLR